MFNPEFIKAAAEDFPDFTIIIHGGTWSYLKKLETPEHSKAGHVVLQDKRVCIIRPFHGKVHGLPVGFTGYVNHEKKLVYLLLKSKELKDVGGDYKHPQPADDQQS